MNTERPTKPISSHPMTRVEIVLKLVDICRKLKSLEDAKKYWEAELDKLSDTDTEVSI